MKRVFAILGATALLTIMPTVPAFAENNAASVSEGFGCGGFVPDADGNFPGDGFIFTSETHSVISNPKKGSKTTLMCHFDIPEELIPDSIRKSTGFLCLTFLGTTTDSKMLATPDGDATLTCRVAV
jgi:hypothetical protein